MRIAGLLLAAGGGSRFGDCKQLAIIDGRPMVRRCLERLAPAVGEDLYIVIGSQRDRIRPVVADLARVIEFPDWRRGLGASIAHGIETVAAGDCYDGILIALADQPYIATAQYRQLLTRFDGERAVAAFYADSYGVPAIFPRSMFAGLRKLEGDRGAKALLKAVPDVIAGVEMTAAARDVDYPRDLE